MGFEPHQPHSNLESVNEFTDCMALRIEEAKAALTKAKDEHTMFTTANASLPRYTHQETESGWMEATSPPTDHRLSSHTDG
jgi:hypothetical protein